MKILISNSLNTPIYEQISSQIKNQIISGELKEGDALPSIRNLARELQISVITTKRAYEILTEEGFINSITGKGSFVASQNQELLREKKMKVVEENLLLAVENAKLLGIKEAEVYEMLKLLYEEL
jgi:GntR family transcriptional regulator